MSMNLSAGVIALPGADVQGCLLQGNAVRSYVASAVVNTIYPSVYHLSEHEAFSTRVHPSLANLSNFCV